MRAYADTSFLFALVLRDENSAAAGDYLRAHRDALPITLLQQCELRNAIRLAVFRRHAAPGAANSALAQIDTDLADGSLVNTELAWPDAFAEAERLSRRHTLALGVRTLDLLHLGAAMSLKLKVFLTFDGRQRSFARAAGLQVGP